MGDFLYTFLQLSGRGIWDTLYVRFKEEGVKLELHLSTKQFEQGRAEEFQMGVALTLFAREIFLDTTPSFRLFDVVLAFPQFGGNCEASGKS